MTPSLKRFVGIGIIQSVLLLILCFAYYRFIPLAPDQWLKTDFGSLFGDKINHPWLISWVLLLGVFYTLSDKGGRYLPLMVLSVVYGLIAAVLMHFSPMNGYGITIAVASSFALLCLLQQYYQQSASRLDYMLLFNAVWNNVSAILLAFVFLFLAIAVLLLWAELFNAIHVNWFQHVFESLLFWLIAGPMLFVVGLFTVFKLQTICDNARYILLSFCRLLLPVIALISVLYMIASVIDWSGASNAGILHSLLPVLALLGVIFINTTYQAGNQKLPLLFKWSAWVLIVCMSLLLIRDLHDRFYILHGIPWGTLIQNVDDVSGFVGVALLLLYYLSYLVAYKRQWQWVNVALAWLLIVVSIALSFLPLPAQPKSQIIDVNTPDYTLSDAGIRWALSQQLASAQPIVLGYNQRGSLYACRGLLKGVMRAGELHNGHCNVITGKKSHSIDRFEILAGDGHHIIWQPPYASNTKQYFAVVVAKQSNSGKALRICRTIYKNNIRVGSYDGSHCLIVADGKAISVINYRVLFAQPKS